MRVSELWRYPVKSLQGERLESATVTREGLEGDRRYAIYDLDTGRGLTARRIPELLFGSARVRAGGGVEITLPDGSSALDDAALSAWLGRAVALRSADDPVGRRYENVVDFERESGAWEEWDGPGGAFHDSAAARLSLVSTATIGAWDRRRFRPNILLEGEGEDVLAGTTVRLGEAVVAIGMPMGRCVMTTRAQPGGIERDLDVMRTIARERDACLAVAGLVTEPGIARVGDELLPI